MRLKELFVIWKCLLGLKLELAHLQLAAVKRPLFEKRWDWWAGRRWGFLLATTCSWSIDEERLGWDGLAWPVTVESEWEGGRKCGLLFVLPAAIRRFSWLLALDAAHHASGERAAKPECRVLLAR
ncbi:hypothetical protein BDZ45DRAFT_667865 [Acephala macrosclerotiorum]|nr:hypothetical protein BDZ45DRAFT_667865 [Acephala macrosclerotiorum]